MNERLCPNCGAYWLHERCGEREPSPPFRDPTPKGLLPRAWDVRTQPIAPEYLESVYVLPDARPPRQG